MSESSIFKAAVQLSPEERPEYLNRACGADGDLRRDVESLLRAHNTADSFLEHPAAPPHEETANCPEIAEGPGTVIGPYKLMEQIGEGGFGLVFVAEQQQPVRRKVALKIIKPGMDSRDVIARFEAERQALALMDHPNIARVFDAGTTDSGRPYFVMELVRGIPIVDYCDQQCLTTQERLELFLSVCRAVQHAHGKGIIHRDLKPSNVMVAPHDGTPVVKVIDFGVAKAIGPQLTDKTVYTRFNQLIGTPLYMSPEQAEINALDVDIRSDVYSLGVLLYELLTGATPFDRERFSTAAWDEVRRIIREENPPSPSHRLSTLGATATAVSSRRGTEPAKLTALIKGDLDWIVMKALEKDRGRRYETASAFAADVKRYLDGEPIEARPPSLGYRLRLVARRHRVALTTSTLVALSMIIGTALSVWQAARASEAETAALAVADRANQSEQEARRQEQLASRERDSAVAAREELRRVLYASEMNLIQAAWEDDNYRRVDQLLDQTRPGDGETDLRGFEWHFWNRRLHPADMRSIRIEHGEARRPTATAFSADGSRLAVFYRNPEDMSVVIRDTATGQELVSFVVSSGSAHELDFGFVGPFSPDGKLLVVVTRTGDDDQRLSIVRFCDASTGEERFRIEEPRTVRDWRFSGDGKRFAFDTFARDPNRQPGVGYRPGNRPEAGVQVWDVETGALLYTHTFGRDVFPRLLSLGDDGSRLGYYWLVRGETAVRLRILDAPTAEEVDQRLFEAASGLLIVDRVSSQVTAWSNARAEKTEIVDAQTLKTLAVLPSMGTGRTRGAFSPDGRLLATAGGNSIRVWRLEGGDGPSPTEIAEPLLTLPDDSNGKLCFDADNRRLFSSDRNRIRSWDVSHAPATVREKWSLPVVAGAGEDWLSPDEVVSGSFSTDGSAAVLLTNRSHFQQPSVTRIWDAVQDHERSRFQEVRENRGLSFPVFSPDDRLVAVVSADARFATTNSRYIHRDDVQEPPELLLLNPQTGELLQTIHPADALEMISPVFHPDGTHVAALLVQGPAEAAMSRVVVWDSATGEEVLSIELKSVTQLVGGLLPGGWSTPQLVGYSPDGEELIVADREGGVTFYGAATGERRRILAPEGTTLNNHGAWSLSPDGRQLAVFGLRNLESDVAVDLYDAATGKLRHRIPTHTIYSPLAVAWNADASRIVLLSSGSQGGDVSVLTVWDTQTGRLLLTLAHEGLQDEEQVRGQIRFTPDGNRLLHLAGNGTRPNDLPHPIQIWDALDEQVLPQAKMRAKLAPRANDRTSTGNP